jgi:hypothetical protein
MSYYISKTLNGPLDEAVAEVEIRLQTPPGERAVAEI